jgi:toxin ParE1/3/4
VGHVVAPRAQSDLDDIWLRIARDSGSIEIANRLIDSITDRFFLLGAFPFMGRSREALGIGCRAFVVGDYVIVYEAESIDVRILRVVHGRRDLEALFSG